MTLHRYSTQNLADTKRLLEIDEVVCDRIQFHERLFVMDENQKKIGRFSINVLQQQDENNSQQYFSVHISNQAVINQTKTSNTCTGTITRTLKTLNEIRIEKSDVTDASEERRMFLLRELTKYYCKHICKKCDVEVEEHTTIPFAKTTGLISEAGNVLLLRIIAIRGFEGILSLTTILSNGKRCKNYYVSRLTKKPVNGEMINVMNIHRTVTNHKNYNLQTTAVLTRTGQLLSFFWSDTNVFLNIQPETKVLNTMMTEVKNIKLHRRWQQYDELYSYYLDEKAQEMTACRSYLIDKTELKRLLSDFIEQVLLTQPSDILLHAVDFFTRGKKSSETDKKKVEIEECYIRNLYVRSCEENSDDDEDEYIDCRSTI